MRATNAKIEERTGRNLVAAIGIGLGFGAVFLFSLIVIKEIYMVFAAVLLGFVALEVATALRATGRHVPRVASIIAAVALVPAAFYSGANSTWLNGGGQWIFALGGMAFVTLWRIIENLRPSLRSSPRKLGSDILAGIFIQAYAVFLGSFTVLLTGEPDGQWWTLALLVVVISTDTGAYVSGLLLGKHKMAPRISPKKTWEGFVGSILAALIAGVLVALFMIHVSVWVGLLFGFTLALVSTLGDLTESLIKRDLGIKDISNWLPGHGGLLDRLDSVLPSAAVAYALFLLFHSAR
jgi:phosphatidate cytidylyltransferase